jgi:hypothetical protein
LHPLFNQLDVEQISDDVDNEDHRTIDLITEDLAVLLRQGTNVLVNVPSSSHNQILVHVLRVEGLCLNLKILEKSILLSIIS